MTISNELRSTPFATNPQIFLKYERTPDISFTFSNSPRIIFNIMGTVKSPVLESESGLTLLLVPRDTHIDDLCLRSFLLVKILQTKEGVLAESWLEGIYEYGSGQIASEAVIDLIISLGEYLDSLEEREARLGESAKRELDALRKLVTRKT